MKTDDSYPMCTFFDSDTQDTFYKGLNLKDTLQVSQVNIWNPQHPKTHCAKKGSNGTDSNSIAKDAKRIQGKNYKQVLDIGDVGVVQVGKNIWGATDFPWVPITVT